MTISENAKKDYMQKILLARMSILSSNGFYGLLLMHVKFAIDDSVRTAATDGERIYFSPGFLDELSVEELRFIMLHEMLHIVLRHSTRTNNRNHMLFNIATDIVVNSNILYSSGNDLSRITLSHFGESMHTTPLGTEGYLYTAEEVYEMLVERAGDTDDYSSCIDDHSRWGTLHDKSIENLWKNRIRDAYEATHNRPGMISQNMERLVSSIKDSMMDWRILLNDFIQEEIIDYSFIPPDYRFQDAPFILPALSIKEPIVKNLLFMVDTSASMSDEDVTQVFSEVYGAIEQFNGNLDGWIGFFDADVYKPIPFSSINDLAKIRPKGGGGTSFVALFDYVFDKEAFGSEYTCVIILTDGFATFPDKDYSQDTPVLWLINNGIITPPWGTLARIK